MTRCNDLPSDGLGVVAHPFVGWRRPEKVTMVSKQHSDQAEDKFWRNMVIPGSIIIAAAIVIMVMGNHTGSKLLHTVGVIPSNNVPQTMTPLIPPPAAPSPTTTVPGVLPFLQPTTKTKVKGSTCLLYTSDAADEEDSVD